jgi:hypothetical protein
MPEFILTFIGIIGGLLAIAGAMYVAARPEMGLTPRKSWLAKPSGQPHNPGIAGSIGLSNFGEGGGGHYN